MKFYPSRTLVGLLLLPLLLAPLSLVHGPAGAWLWLVDLVLFLIAGLDLWLARRPLVTLDGNIPAVMSVGRGNPFSIYVQNRSARNLRLKLGCDLFLGATSTLPVHGVVDARAHRVFSAQLTPSRRGEFEFGALLARYRSPLGCFTVQVQHPTRHSVRVYPDLVQLRQYDLQARQSRGTEFSRASRRRGGQSEFARLRDYTQDDEYRSIDWHATARRQKLTVREYQLESNQDLLFMLDCGRTMCAEVQGLSQFDHALNASLMLGHIALRNGDHVGLFAFDSEVRSFVPPARGPGTSNKLVASSYHLYPQLVESDFELAFQLVGQRQRKRALVVLFTHVADETAGRTLLRACHALARNHLPLVVLFRDLDVEGLLTNGTTRRDLYVRGAAALLTRERSKLVSELRKGGALVVDTSPAELSSHLLDRYIEVKARHLL